MNRLTNYLLLLLAAQLLILVWAFWPGQSSDTDDSRQALFTIAEQDTNRVILDDGKSSIVLSKVGGEWRLPAYHNLPVAQNRVDALYADLPHLNRGFPVANSDAAKSRFEVATDNFQRKIQYFADEQLVAEAYLGTSPGFRNVHVRIGEEDNIYSIKFNAFDLPTNPAELFDKNVLRIPLPKHIEGLDYAISKTDDTWLDSDQNLADSEAAHTLANGLSGLRVNAVADISTANILQDTPAPPTLKVDTDNGSYEIHLYQVKEAYYIKRNDMALYFEISKFDHDRLNDVSFATLFPPPAP